MLHEIKTIIKENIDTKERLLHDELLHATIKQIVYACLQTYRQGGKILMCGNGGSAADAQHLAAEFSGRFYKDRAPLFAEALQVNTSYITSVANDYGYDEIFARAVRGMGKKGDILWAFSTSGNSANILKAIEAAKKIGVLVVGFSGQTGGKMGSLCDFLINVPSEDTPRIQETHILVGHIICQLVEAEYFG